MSGNGAVCGLHTPPPVVDKNSGERRRRRRSPAPPPLPVSPPFACVPSHPSSVASLLVPLAVTWHWGLGSLSLSLAGDDVAAGMWAVMGKGGWWWASGDVAVRWWWWASNGVVTWRRLRSRWGGGGGSDVVAGCGW
jgi:hypothetical protein